MGFASLYPSYNLLQTTDIAERVLLRLARKRNLPTGPRQNNPAGKSPKTLSSLFQKNIPLNASGKSVI
jgi:hypothetical protein